jgi:hypothetical protein
VIYYIWSLFQSTRDRLNEFEDLKRVHTMVASTLNDVDQITLDRKYTILKDKYNRLLDSLTQRLGLLDEANRKFNRIKIKIFIFFSLKANEMNSINKMTKSKNFINNYKMIFQNLNNNHQYLTIIF